MTTDTIRFAVVGVAHGHVHGQIRALLDAGCACVGCWVENAELAAQFAARYPDIPLVAEQETLLDDPTVQIITTATVPNLRGPLGIAAMRRGKDFLTDKPGFTTLEQLAEARTVQAETGRIYAISFGRHDSRSTLKAGELVRQCAIGDVVQFIGLGPHRMGLEGRPDWFVERERYGGIIVDLASHQFDHFLYFTGSTEAEIVAAQVANYKHAEHPELEELGEVMVRGDKGTALIRVDWYNPDGSKTWGDTRLLVLGTEGYIEVRPTIDLAGQPGGDHLFLVNQEDTQRIDCADVPLDFGQRFVNDVRHRTETAQDQAMCFLACELSLKAQVMAAKLGNLE